MHVQIFWISIHRNSNIIAEWQPLQPIHRFIWQLFSDHSFGKIFDVNIEL